MKKIESFNIIPSFESLSYICKEPTFFSNEMKLIMSKNNIQSFKSFDDIAGKHNFREVEELSIEQYQEDKNDTLEKDVIGTKESFKTPRKKVKTGCICKKTGCLKLYCECFASGKACTEECVCCNCSNSVDNNLGIETARSFRKGKLKNKEEKRVCNCKKSKCQKKYCECYNAGVSCSSECKCDGCSNTENGYDQKHSCNQQSQSQFQSHSHSLIQNELLD